jgi:hypothetical protein
MSLIEDLFFQTPWLYAKNIARHARRSSRFFSFGSTGDER